jgi:transcription initiation factor TFIID subunit TAF12
MGEEEMGLAQKAAADGAGGLGQQMPTVEEIAQLLMQGITPEELAEAGVPTQLIQQAIAMAQQMAQVPQQQQQQQQVEPTQGLAGKAAMGM